jgi:hypothetical protein
MTPELNAQIAVWRQAAIDNTLTLDQMKQAIVALRGGRVSAAIASSTSKAKKAPMQVQDSDSLMDELFGG